MKKKVLLIVILAIVLVLLAAVAIVLGVLKTKPGCVHTYSSWSKVDENNHKSVCTLCNEEHTAQHAWDQGVAIEEATCKDGGRITYTCADCGAKKTEDTLALTEHTYDNACDTDCNVCGQTRQTAHVAAEAWGKDTLSHWKECAQCGAQMEMADHIPGPAATESAPQTCTGCGYILQPVLGHQHAFADGWTTDKTGHWHTCAGCEEKKDYAQHAFDNGCDPDCGSCGYTRQAGHTYGSAWTSDKTGHWHACGSCGDKKDFGSHSYDGEFDDNCNTCSYARGIMNYEKYSNMSGDEQQAFYQSFADPLEFFDWLEKAKEYDEKNKDDIIIDGDGVIDLGDLMNGGN